MGRSPACANAQCTASAGTGAGAGAGARLDRLAAPGADAARLWAEIEEFSKEIGADQHAASCGPAACAAALRAVGVRFARDRAALRRRLHVRAAAAVGGAPRGRGASMGRRRRRPVKTMRGWCRIPTPPSQRAAASHSGARLAAGTSWSAAGWRLCGLGGDARDALAWADRANFECRSGGCGAAGRACVACELRRMFTRS